MPGDAGEVEQREEEMEDDGAGQKVERGPVESAVPRGREPGRQPAAEQAEEHGDGGGHQQRQGAPGRLTRGGHPAGRRSISSARGWRISFRKPMAYWAIWPASGSFTE